MALTKTTRHSPRSRQPRRRAFFRPFIELLEARLAPAAINVTTTSDVVDADPTTITIAGLASVVTNPDGLVSLREAIDAANNTAGGDTINLAKSTYTLDQQDNFWYGPNGLPAISSDITIEGNGAVIARDSAAPTFRFFYISGGLSGLAAGALTLHDLTLRGGLARGGNGGINGGGGAGMGGAVFNQGSLSLVGVTLTANTATGGNGGGTNPGGDIEGGGGGMGSNGANGGGGGGFGGTVTGGGKGGTPSAQGYAGGGGGFNTNGVDGSTANGGAGGGGSLLGGISGTGASAGDGGGGGGPLINQAGKGGDFGLGAPSGFGGGGVGGGGAGGGAVSIGGVFVSGNGGGGGFGGGGGGARQQAPGKGGFGGGGGGSDGIGFASSAPGGFGGGSGAAGGGGGAGMGGAIFNHGGSLQITNSTLTGNATQGGNGYGAGAGMGGAIFNLNGSVAATNSSLAGNSVTQGSRNPFNGPATNQTEGGAVCNIAYGNDILTGGTVTATLTLVNTILADSTGASVTGFHDLYNASVNGAGTNIATVIATAPNIVETRVGSNINSGGIITSDPKLGPLQDNGGLAPTMALLVGSPAIDTGTSDGAPTSDQRGVQRYNAVDIGAFEFVPNQPPTCDIKPFPATTDESGPQSVPNWITNCSPGLPTESAQQITVSLMVNKPEFFSALPAVDANGTLTFTPAPNVRGSGIVTVTIRDDGGTANGGVDTSSSMRSFQIDKPRLWWNAINHLDVTNDTHVAANDAVAVVNYINAFGSFLNGKVPPLGTILGGQSVDIAQPFGFLDDNGDGFVAANDALDVINAINAGEGEGERDQWTGDSGQWPVASSQGSDQALNDLLALLAGDGAGQPKRR